MMHIYFKAGIALPAVCVIPSILNHCFHLQISMTVPLPPLFRAKIFYICVLSEFLIVWCQFTVVSVLCHSTYFYKWTFWKLFMYSVSQIRKTYTENLSIPLFTNKFLHVSEPFHNTLVSWVVIVELFGLSLNTEKGQLIPKSLSNRFFNYTVGPVRDYRKSSSLVITLLLKHPEYRILILYEQQEHQ